MKTLATLRRQTSAAILALNKRREAIDAELRPLLQIMELIDGRKKPMIKSVRRVVNEKLTRPQMREKAIKFCRSRTEVTPKILAAHLGTTAEAARQRLDGLRAKKIVELISPGVFRATAVKS